MRVKSKQRRTFEVGVVYTVRGVVEVEAKDEAEARELAHDEMTCPGTCEIPDWETTTCKEMTE